jgi:hypothetical protein
VQAFGWALLGVGLFISLAIGLLLSLFSTASALIVGGLLALFSVVTFLLVRTGGKKLEASGEEAQEQRREQALFALAHNRGGMLQAVDAARVLDLTESDADGFLTRMAKQKPDIVNVDIGEQGEVFYTFLKIVPAGAARPSAWNRPRVRVDIASAPRPQPPIDPAVIDAEFEAIDDAARAQGFPRGPSGAQKRRH